MPPRNVRRRLERRGDAVLAKLPYVEIADPDDSIALVREDRGSASGVHVAIVDTALAALMLLTMGAGSVVQEIATERLRRPGTLPTVVVVDGWASVAFVRVRMMSPGGES